MLRTGSIILTAWCALNLVPSFVILGKILLLGQNSPTLYAIASVEEIDGAGENVVATMNSIAVFANGMTVAFCLLALAAIWFGLYRRQRWAFWALFAGFSAALLAGVAADEAVGWAFPEVNLGSGIVLAVGMILSVRGLLRDGRASTDA